MEWNIHPTCATPHYTIFVNDTTKEAVVAARGSYSPISDWVVNDIFGFLHGEMHSGQKIQFLTRSGFFPGNHRPFSFVASVS
jgi:hypothetical protein